MGWFRQSFSWMFPGPVAPPAVGSFYAPSGGSVDSLSDSDPDTTNRIQGWQIRAWQLWRCVGELHAPTSYVARIISRRLEWRQSGPSELDTGATANRIQDALGETGMEEFVRLVVLNLQVAGELWVVQTDKGWDVLSVQARDLKRRVEDARKAGRVARRVYDPDPSDTALADSAMRAVLDPAEELVVLAALSRAQSRSRIAQAGVLLVPIEQKFEGGDPFGATLEQAMTSAIKDVSSPSALAPIKVDMAADLIEKVRHLTFERSFDDAVGDKMEKATRRIALGLDLPAELLLGLGENSSHWGAWAVQDESYKGTIAPLAEKVAGVLELVVRTTNTDETRIDPDPTDLLARRSTTRDAFEGARLGAVGLDYVRKSMGAADTDKPTPQDLEIIRYVGSRGRSASDDARSDAAGDQVQDAPQGGNPVNSPAGG